MSDTGAYLLQKLDELASASPLGVEARGRGLLLGLELTEPARPICEVALERGLMLNMVQGNVLRFLPSFLLEREHVDTAMRAAGRTPRLRCFTANGATEKFWWELLQE